MHAHRFGSETSSQDAMSFQQLETGPGKRAGGVLFTQNSLGKNRIRDTTSLRHIDRRAFPNQTRPSETRNMQRPVAGIRRHPGSSTKQVAVYIPKYAKHTRRDGTNILATCRHRQHAHEQKPQSAASWWSVSPYVQGAQVFRRRER